nr:pickpocket protein 28-like isoform X1 [Plodia interpunctella]
MSLILDDRFQNENNIRTPDSRFHIIRNLLIDYISFDDPKFKRRKNHGKLRYLGVIIFLFGALLSLILIISLWTKWTQSGLVIINADKLVPVHEIPFPAVTVCLESKSLPYKYNFTENYHLYNNSETRARMSNLDREMFEDLTLVCDSHLNSAIGRNFSKPDDTLVNLMVGAPSISEAMFMCKWKHKHYIDHCSDLFSQALTEEGLCFTFNMLGDDDIFRQENLHQDYGYTIHNTVKRSTWNLESGYSVTKKDTYPRRVSGYGGADMGLAFLLKQNKEDLDYLCRGPVQGSKIHVHNPAEFPRMSSHYFRTAVDQESVVSIKAQMLTTAEALRSYSPERRQCYFAEERYLHYFKLYTQSNCEFECLTNHTYEKCGCVHIGMPRGPEMKICNTGKVECMNDARNEFMEQELDAILKQGKHCNCLPPCTSISYEAEISQADYDFKAFCEAHRIGPHDGVNPNVLMSRVKLFFKSTHFMASQRMELYGATDFIADCGGIVALFLGISCLGTIKFFYIIASRSYNFYREQNKKMELVGANSSSAINES